MNFNTLHFQTHANGIVVITVNRPDKLNALNSELLDELSEAFQQVRADKKIKGVLLCGTGEKAFVAGADIKELQSLDKVSGEAASQKGHQIFQSVEDTRKPVVAVIHGYALGGGAELAMACHLRVASPDAVFGLPEAGLGLIPGYGGTQRLPKIVGHARALEMILTGKHINADQALHIGLVNSITKNPIGDATDLLNKILSNGPIAISNALKAVYASNGKNGFQVEADLFGQLCATQDAKEGTAAFLEKRKPKFKGR